jgi:hypothetical protein
MYHVSQVRFMVTIGAFFSTQWFAIQRKHGFFTPGWNAQLQNEQQLWKRMHT